MNKTWLITGASSGFGRLMTEKLLARGDQVVATLRREGALDELQQTYGELLTVVTLDLSDETTIIEATRQAFAGREKIDVVISNAGYGTFGALEELTSTQIKKQVESNLIGTILFVQALLPYLRAQGGGRILQVTSEGGQTTYPGFSTYHASKWGQEGFIEAVRKEVALFGIEMCLVEPGPTETNFAHNLDMGKPQKAYAQSPVEDMRKAFQSGDFSVFMDGELSMGNAENMASEMLKLGDATELPFRVPMGSVAWENIHREYSIRLDHIKQQKELAYRCDNDAT